jgi:hypothetical protein
MYKKSTFANMQKPSTVKRRKLAKGESKITDMRKYQKEYARKRAKALKEASWM